MTDGGEGDCCGDGVVAGDGVAEGDGCKLTGALYDGVLKRSAPPNCAAMPIAMQTVPAVTPSARIIGLFIGLKRPGRPDSGNKEGRATAPGLLVLKLREVQSSPPPEWWSPEPLSE